MKMLQIRHQQFEQLQESCERGFLRRLQSILMETHPVLIAAVPEMSREWFITDMRVQAKAYGLTTESNVYQFVAASLKHGAGFERTPPFEKVHALLLRPEVNQNLKMMQLNEAMRVQFEEPPQTEPSTRSR